MPELLFSQLDYNTYYTAATGYRLGQRIVLSKDAQINVLRMHLARYNSVLNMSIEVWTMVEVAGQNIPLNCLLKHNFSNEIAPATAAWVSVEIPTLRLDAGNYFIVINGNATANGVHWSFNSNTPPYSDGISSPDGVTWTDKNGDFAIMVYADYTRTGTGSAAEKYIRNEYPITEGLTAGTTKHLE